MTPTRTLALALTAVAAALAPTALAVPAAHAAHAIGFPRSPLDRRLTVVYDDGSGRARTYALGCGDPYRASDAPACDRLTEIGGPLGPVPAGQACSMIYGGPQTAHVTGMWDGRRVDETYRRTNGCEVARWNRMEPVLPSATTPHMRPLAG